MKDAPEVVKQVRAEIRRSEVARYDHRLHAVLLVAGGLTSPQVARLLGDAPRSVQNWVRYFEERGFVGLTERPRPGPPGLLSPAQFQEMDEALRHTPRHCGLSGKRWDGPTLSAWLERRFQLHLGVRQCQRLMWQRGFGWPKLRPAGYHAPPARPKKNEETPGAGR